MITKDEFISGLDMYHERSQDENGVVIGTKPSTVNGAMWFSVEDDLYWSVYVCMNGSRIEIAYGQFRTRN